MSITTEEKTMTMTETVQIDERPPNTISGNAPDSEKVAFYEGQIERLATVLMRYFPDEPGRLNGNESAIDTSVRLLTNLGERRAAPASTASMAEILNAGAAARLSVSESPYAGRVTFSERFVAASIEQSLQEEFGKRAEVWSVEPDQGNTVVLHMPDDDEGCGLVISVREVESVPATEVTDGR